MVHTINKIHTILSDNIMCLKLPFYLMHSHMLYHYREKDVIGYDLEDLIDVDQLDFVHPADYPRLLPAKQYCK